MAYRCVVIRQIEWYAVIMDYVVSQQLETCLFATYLNSGK